LVAKYKRSPEPFALLEPAVAPEPIVEAAFALPPVDGADVICTVTVVVSPTTFVDGNVTVIGMMLTAPDLNEVAAPIEIDEATRPLAAVAGATEVKTPKPKAETATSAMRLRVVFVDICFLSIKVDSRAFPESAWRRNGLSSDMRGSFLSVGITVWICRWLE
jgi:hypothetical protein